ncbi:MAG: ECF-type sigma factor [Planctomycetota bacterium]
METPSRLEFTRVVAALRDGNDRAADELVPHLYAELRRLAESHLRNERRDHTLQPTALVHEAYLKLIERDDPLEWENRKHFLAWASSVMRNVLVSHARRHRAKKRGGDHDRVALGDTLVQFEERAVNLEALDEALNKLAEFDARKSRIVELRFFGGLKLREVAELLELSTSTIDREWEFTRGWLHREIRKGDR